MTTQLTSVDEIERLYSISAVELRTDDSNDASALLDEIVNWASETVASYTLQHYDTTVLVNSAWTRRRTTILAAYYLSMRRANAPQFVAQAKQVMQDLELVRDNKIIIPDAYVRASDIPAVASYRIDDRYIVGKQRVVPSQSTKPYPGQQMYDLPFVGDDTV